MNEKIQAEGVAGVRRSVVEHLISELNRPDETAVPREFSFGEPTTTDSPEHVIGISSDQMDVSGSFTQFSNFWPMKDVGEVRLLSLGSRTRVRVIAFTDPPAKFNDSWTARPDIVKRATDEIQQKLQDLDIWSKPLVPERC